MIILEIIGRPKIKYYIFVPMQLLRKILWPFSLLYGLGVLLRNLSYDLGWRKINSFQTPTICVGNLSLGGTGKTPMIEWLIRHLSYYEKIAVLSRGYKRESTGFKVAGVESTALEIGDEPLQIQRKFPDVLVAVDGDRSRGISRLEKEFQPDVILLDDAYQHRKVKAGFYILLTAYNKLYPSDHFIPTGNLRDAKNQAKRANLIIVTKCPQDLDEDSMEAMRKELKPTKNQEVLFCCFDYSSRLISTAGELNLDQFSGELVTVATGIASPEPLLQYLAELGLETRHRKYNDHHQFSPTELSALSKEKIIITTEKDYVRGLNQLSQVYYLEVQHRFLADGKERLLKSIGRLKR
jgi:tetraacyldisaccharide 4'-kinase